FELGDRLLERHVPPSRARQRPGRGGAPAVLPRRAAGRLGEARILADAQVVVRAERRQLAAVDRDERPADAVDHARLAHEAGAAEFLEFGPDELREHGRYFLTG